MEKNTAPNITLIVRLKGLFISIHMIVAVIMLEKTNLSCGGELIATFPVRVLLIQNSHWVVMSVWHIGVFSPKYNYLFWTLSIFAHKEETGINSSSKVNKDGSSSYRPLYPLVLMKPSHSDPFLMGSPQGGWEE